MMGRRISMRVGRVPFFFGTPHGIMHVLVKSGLRKEKCPHETKNK